MFFFPLQVSKGNIRHFSCNLLTGQVEMESWNHGGISDCVLTEAVGAAGAEEEEEEEGGWNSTESSFLGMREEGKMEELVVEEKMVELVEGEKMVELVEGEKMEELVEGEKMEELVVGEEHLVVGEEQLVEEEEEEEKILGWSVPTLVLSVGLPALILLVFLACRLLKRR